MAEEGVKYPGQHDFLLGRGGETNNHSGNIMFRQLIKQEKDAYQSAPKTQKPLISQKIVAKWRAMNPPGRFLERSGPDNTWKDVGDAVACRKTSKALGERGKRNKQGVAPTAAFATDPLAGAKRKPVEDMAPPAARLKAAPPPVAAATTNTNTDLGTLLQGLNAERKISAAVPQPPPAANVAALLEQHQKQQQQQAGIAALVELQKRQQQQSTTDVAALLAQVNSKPSPAASLLGHTSSPAPAVTPELLAAALLDQEKQKKQNELSVLLGQVAVNNSKTNYGNIDFSALLAGQQQQQQQQTPTSSLLALLEQRKQEQQEQQAKTDLLAVLKQEQQKQELRSSLATLLSQQTQQQSPDLAALLAEQQKNQQVEAALASLVGQSQSSSAPQPSAASALAAQKQPANQELTVDRVNALLSAVVQPGRPAIAAAPAPEVSVKTDLSDILAAIAQQGNAAAAAPQGTGPQGNLASILAAAALATGQPPQQPEQGQKPSAGLIMLKQVPAPVRIGNLLTESLTSRQQKQPPVPMPTNQALNLSQTASLARSDVARLPPSAPAPSLSPPQTSNSALAAILSKFKGSHSDTTNTTGNNTGPPF